MCFLLNTSNYTYFPNKANKELWHLNRVKIHYDRRIIQQKLFNYEAFKITSSKCKNSKNISKEESLIMLKFDFKNLLRITSWMENILST